MGVLSTVPDQDPFSAVWGGLHHCMQCNALHRGVTCVVCGHTMQSSMEPRGPKGELAPTFITQGAIPYSVYLLLDRMRFEWLREPSSSSDDFPYAGADRLVIVILFWTLFETLMERFYLAAFADLPGELGEELLQRFPSIGGRLDRLYKRRWGTTFWADLEDLGHAEAAALLRKVQAARNAFVHGDPKAIDDALVNETVRLFRPVQRGWVDVFNKRCTGMTRRVQLWMKDTPTMIPAKA